MKNKLKFFLNIKKKIFSKKAFTLVELLIAISIIVILWVISYTYYSWLDQKAVNAKVKNDLSTLNDSLVMIKQTTRKLPDPAWNNNFFDNFWDYSHSSSWAFWVYWKITKNILKWFSDSLKVAKINRYYTYWKKINNSKFNLAWVIKNDLWDFESIVLWTYEEDASWTKPYSLIKSYDWPEFVVDKDKNNFPYNPEEKKLTAKIWDFKWTIEINWVPKTKQELKNMKLFEWDKIKFIWTNNTDKAKIYYSDWSYSELSSNTEIILANMDYKSDDDLFTNIKIFLNSWKLWTKATKLAKESEFEVYTSDSVVAVRWTIFWVEKNSGNKTKIELEKWKIAVYQNNETDTEKLKKKLKQKKFDKITKNPITLVNWINEENGESIMEVKDWEPWKSFEFEGKVESMSGTVDTTPPTITLNWSWVVSVDVWSNYTDLWAECGTLSLTASWTVNTTIPWRYTLTYTCTDIQWNISTQTRIVKVIDRTSPTIILNWSWTVNVLKNTTFTDSWATWTDNVDGTWTITSASSWSVDITTVWTYTLTYTKVDTSWNTWTVTRTVKVIESDEINFEGLIQGIDTTRGLKIIMDPGKIDDFSFVYVDDKIIWIRTHLIEFDDSNISNDIFRQDNHYNTKFFTTNIMGGYGEVLYEKENYFAYFTSNNKNVLKNFNNGNATFWKMLWDREWWLKSWIRAYSKEYNDDNIYVWSGYTVDKWRYYENYNDLVGGNNIIEKDWKNWDSNTWFRNMRDQKLLAIDKGDNWSYTNFPFWYNGSKNWWCPWWEMKSWNCETVQKYWTLWIWIPYWY